MRFTPDPYHPSFPSNASHLHPFKPPLFRPSVTDNVGYSNLRRIVVRETNVSSNLGLNRRVTRAAEVDPRESRGGAGGSCTRWNEVEMHEVADLWRSEERGNELEKKRDVK